MHVHIDADLHAMLAQIRERQQDVVRVGRRIGGGGSGGGGLTPSEVFLDPAVPSSISRSIDAPFSFLIEFTTGADVTTTQFVFTANDGTANNRFLVYVSGGNVRVQVRQGGANRADFVAGAVTGNTTHKVAIRTDTNNHGASLDGATVVTATGVVWAAGVLNDSYLFGANTVGEASFTGTIARVAEYETKALDDATLISLSS
ncbi:MAG: hypothetical protein GEU78_07830 [Actinobacteria bacterium]|nr:hypothetical protein [Actinomycetota bacterium]